MNARHSPNNRRKSRRIISQNTLTALHVQTAVRRKKRIKIGWFVWRIMAGIVFMGLLSGIACLAVKKFFYINQEYALRHLLMHLNGIMTEKDFITLTGFSRGKNLFSVDLEQASKKLAALPEVKSVSLERILPDTIKVSLERRLPIFLLAFSKNKENDETFIPSRSYLCDSDGVIMQPSSRDEKFRQLPILKGLNTSDAIPGEKFESDSIDLAIKLEQALQELPEEIFKIRSIDISKSYAAIVTDASGARFTFGMRGEDFPAQIERLRKLLAYCQRNGQKIATANLIPFRNTPVTFQMKPINKGEMIIPTSKFKKQ